MFTRYKIIRSFKELKQLVEACLNTGYASVDFETNAEGIYKDTFKPTILSVSFQVGSGCSIPLQHLDESVKEIPWLKWLQYFGRRVVENPNIVKVAQNFKFDNQIFVKYGIYVRGTVIDTMLAKYLLNEEKPHGLKPMVAKYLPEFADYEKYDKFETIPWDKKPLEPLARYGCRDTDFTLRLALFLEKKLIDKGFYNLYRNLIMPASKVLQDAETNGLPIDLSFNDFLQDKYSKLIQETNDKLRSVRQIKRYQKYSLEQRKRDYIDKLTQEIEELSSDPKKAKSIKNREDKISRILAGEYKTNDEKKLIEPVNFNSTKQMVDLLYLSPKGFKFPIVEYTKDKRNKPTDNPSTSEDTLIKISDQDKTGFIKSLLDLRGLDKMNSTYIVGLRELVQSDNKVHPTFLIHGCVSGNTRLVCKDRDIKIKDICPREMGILNVEDKNIWILSHEGTWEQVTHTINKGKQPLYKIVTKDGDILKCTKEHKLLTPQGWKKVSYIFKHNLNVVMYDTSRLDITKPIVGKRYDEIIFRDIPGWDGYIASSEGKIYSVKIPGGRGMLDYNHPHELVPREWKPGRLRVYLRNNSKKKYAFPVSHLVWMAFNSKLYVPEKMVIDHINCNTLDNRPENLQCITYSENIKRAYKYTRTAFTSNSINGASKFNTLTISKVLEDYQNGHTQAEICERYGISQKQVSGIVNGQRRKDIYLTKLVSMEYGGDKTIYDLSVNDKHSYITRSNFINSNTTSGRLSSRNPNGQNIPKVMVNPDIKKQFIPPSGKLFLTYDYSQAELRILAHLANEETMLEWFRTGKDIHLASACKKYHEDYDKIIKIYEDEQHELYPLWKKRRKQAKTINFGVCFSGDTEILTEKGWQRFDLLERGLKVAQYDQNTNEIDFIKPTKYIEHKNQKLFLHESKCTNICATDNHRLLIKSTKRGKNYKEVFIKDLRGVKGYSPSAGKYKNNFIDDNITRFIAIVASDGNFFRPHVFRFCFKKDRKIERLEVFLKNNNLTYKKRETKRYTTFHVKTRGTKFENQVEKYLTPSKDLNIQAIYDLNGEIYLDEAKHWDGTITKKTHQSIVKFSTKSEITANIMQSFGILNNKSITISKVNKLYRLHWRLKSHNETYVKWDFHKVNGLHTVYCVQVPKTNIIIRRKGRVMVVKNCYEQTAMNLSKTLETSQEEAQQFLDEFFQTFPKIRGFIDKQHKFMEKHGYCVSLFGRRRRCPNVYSDKYGEYLEALRQATNAPVQSAASDMALFASIIVWEKIRKGELPPMKEVNTVHDSVYQFIEPKYITPDTIYKVWDICRNPSTKKYFGFEINDVSMDMDFTVGRTMAEELPYVPGYDYNKMLLEDFDEDEYYAEHNKVIDIPIKEYPKEFKSYFEESWRKR